MNTSDDKKETKGALEKPEKQNERKNVLMCWLCKEKHRMMDCHKFKMKLVKDRIDFAAKEKICKNCFSKTHLLKDCICSIKFRTDGCGKKHNTLLHLKARIKQLLIVRTSKTTQSQINSTHFYK